jgi:hypothetical protein
MTLWLRASQSLPLNIAEDNGKNDFDPDSDFDLDKEQLCVDKLTLFGF